MLGLALDMESLGGLHASLRAYADQRACESFTATGAVRNAYLISTVKNLLKTSQIKAFKFRMLHWQAALRP